MNAAPILLLPLIPPLVIPFMSAAVWQEEYLLHAALGTVTAGTQSPGLELRTQPEDVLVWFGLVWRGMPGTFGQRPPEACAMKSAGPDTAVCPWIQVAGPVASWRGREALTGMGAAAQLLLGGAVGHVWGEGDSDHCPLPALKRSWKFRFPENCLQMLTRWEGAGNAESICEDPIPRIWHGHGLAPAPEAVVHAQSRDLSLPCCAPLIKQGS